MACQLKLVIKLLCALEESGSRSQSYSLRVIGEGLMTEYLDMNYQKTLNDIETLIAVG